MPLVIALEMNKIEIEFGIVRCLQSLRGDVDPGSHLRGALVLSNLIRLLVFTILSQRSVRTG
jgi:hypothetical protein